MSRRKQSNPKPLLKSDCQEVADEMTVETDAKDFCDSKAADDVSSSTTITDYDASSEPYQTYEKANESPPITNSPKSPTNSLVTEIVAVKRSASPILLSSSPRNSVETNQSQESSSAPLTTSSKVPKVRLNVALASDPALKPDAKDIKMMHPDGPPLLDDNFKKMDIDDDNSNSCLPQPHGQLKSPIVDMSPRIPVFMCHPCGIRFSSLSTLEAHQTYYCSHRKEMEEEIATSSIAAEQSSSTSSSEPSAKSMKTGKQYACTQCSYSADKKVSLNRHMRMHQSSPAPSSNASNGDDSSSQHVDRYCSDCDIRFSNIKTYRAHKQHYCSSRRTEGQSSTPKPESKKSGSVSPQERSKTPTLIAPPQPFLALPTNPILIIPYSLVRAASLLPGPLTSLAGGIANPDTTCFAFENGTLQPVATVVTTQPVADQTTPRIQTPNNSSNSNVTSNNNNISKNSISNMNNNNNNSSVNHNNTTMAVLLTEKNSKLSNTEPLKSNKKEASSRDTAPLDLSVRKSPVSKLRQRSESLSSATTDDNRIDSDIMLEGKENLSVSSGKVTPEQIVCAPSLPNSPSSLTPSPRRRTASPKGNSISISPGPIPSSPSSNQMGIRPIIPAELALKLTESNIMPAMMSKQNLELALKMNTNVVNKVNDVVVTNTTTNRSNTTPTAASVAAAAVAAAAAAAAAGVNNPNLINLQTPPISIVPSISNVQPQIYVKQGVSKCKECNIVFCKLENYLVHKQHYCSARNQEDTETKIPTPPISGNQNEPGPPQIAYHQLICAACGIKYTSLDNLRAHQTFYCPKGGDLSNAAVAAAAAAATAAVQINIGKEKCTKCKLIHDIGQQCPMNTQGSYKCPVCDVVSLNSADSRKHLETHGSVKAFRCSICRYKGNTLRGMRTHIRMHFDKKTTDFNEEDYMSCILEEEGIEIHSAAPSTANMQQQQDQRIPQQLFNCEICNYSSTYKGNVMRHMKLVHSQHSTPPSTSPEIGEGGESLFQNGDVETRKPEESVIIKVEPTDTYEDTHIKTEPEDKRDYDIIPSSPLSASPSISTTAGIQVTPTSVISQIPPLSCTSPVASEDNMKNSGQKYCQTCDIKFKFMNSYLAHKQFYCKSTRMERGSLSPVQSPVMVNKNKENLETVL